MCMKNHEKESCLLMEQNKQLSDKVENLDSRITKVETEISTIRSDTQEGFRQGAATMRSIDASVANLAHDFGQRFNNIETTVVAEKVKWGETLRWVVKISVRVILAGAAVAMGITVINNFLK